MFKRNKELINIEVDWFLLHFQMISYWFNSHWFVAFIWWLCTLFLFSFPLCWGSDLYITFEFAVWVNLQQCSNKEQEMWRKKKAPTMQTRQTYERMNGDLWYACTWNMWCIAKRNVISTHQRLCGDSPCSFQQNIISFCIVVRSPLFCFLFFFFHSNVCFDVFFLLCAILLQLNSSVDVYKVPFHYRIAMYYNNCLYGHKLLL